MTYNPTYAVDAPDRAEIDALPGAAWDARSTLSCDRR